MKIITWNVNGIRARISNGFWEFIDEQDPDVICLQEVKASEVEVPIQMDLLTRGYGYVWNYNELDRNNSGVATFIKDSFKELSRTYLNTEQLKSGRIQIIRLNAFVLLNLYSPQSGVGLKNQEVRKSWDSDLLKLIEQLRAEELLPIIICGDLNTAHESFRNGNPSMGTKTPGFTQDEWKSFETLREFGFVDVFAENGFGSKYSEDLTVHELNHTHSWRLDYILVDRSFKENSYETFGFHKNYGSDHYAVGVEINTSNQD